MNKKLIALLLSIFLFPFIFHILLTNSIAYVSDYLALKTASYVIYNDEGTVLALSGLTSALLASGTVASAVIQSAINALSSSGGTVFLRAGTYSMQYNTPSCILTLLPNVNLIGEGMSSTIIRVDGGIQSGVDVLNLRGNNTVKNLQIIGDGTANIGDLISNHGHNLMNLALENLEVSYGRQGIGICADNLDSLTNMERQGAHDVFIRNVIAHHNIDNGIYLGAGLHNVVVDGVISYNNTNVGIAIDDGGYGMTLSNIFTRDNGQYSIYINSWNTPYSIARFSDAQVQVSNINAKREKASILTGGVCVSNSEFGWLEIGGSNQIVDGVTINNVHLFGRLWLNPYNYEIRNVHVSNLVIDASDPLGLDTIGIDTIPQSGNNRVRNFTVQGASVLAYNQAAILRNVINAHLSDSYFKSLNSDDMDIEGDSSYITLNGIKLDGTKTLVITGSSDYIYIENSDLNSINNVASATHIFPRNKKGYVTENSGIAKISVGKSVTFNHGLAGKPTFVSCSFSNTGWGSWKWSATSTQITVTVERTGTYLVYWSAEYHP